MLGPIRVLCNSALPEVEGYCLRHFGHYSPNPATWKAESERRTLREILAAIPPHEKPEILIFISPEYLPLPSDLSLFPGLKLLFITDWNVGLRFLRGVCPLFDLCYTDFPGTRLLRLAGVRNVRHGNLFGHNPNRFKLLSLERDLDLSFCGNFNAGLHRQRNRALRGLVPLNESYRLHLSPAFGSDYVQVLNRSRLVFNYSIRGEANMRLYEAMACGAVPLVEQDNVEVPLLFHEGEHYVSYKPEAPAEAIKALLQDPDRLLAMSSAAKAVVGEHSQSKQIGRILSAARTEMQNGTDLTSAEDEEEEETMPTLRPQSSVAQREDKPDEDAWIKLRVLGRGFNVAEALAELQTRIGYSPQLKLQCFPGLLLSALAQSAQKSQPGMLPITTVKVLEDLLGHPDLPKPIASFHRLCLAVWQKDDPAIMVHSKDLMQSVTPVPKTPWPESIYAHFLLPIELGRALNSDINDAYRARITGEGDSQLCALLAAHASLCQAEVRLRQKNIPEAVTVSLAGLVSLDRFLSVSPWHVLMMAMIELGQFQRMREIARIWYIDNPLNPRVWERTLLLAMNTPEKEYVQNYVKNIQRLTQLFFEGKMPDYVQQVIDRIPKEKIQSVGG